MVAVTYVRDIGTSRAFYELLGFGEHSSGKADTSAWLALHRDGHYVLLASTWPPLDIPRLPLLFYFWFDDLDAVLGALDAARVEVAHMGHPPHALGGEVSCSTPTATPSCSASGSDRRPSRPRPMTRPPPISPC
jgi:hypothetical protein